MTHTTFDRIRACDTTATLARGARLFLQWGDREAADMCATRRTYLLEALAWEAKVSACKAYLDAHRHGPYRGMMGLPGLPSWDRYHR